MAADALKTLWLLHGVNLNMLGRRDPAHYGTLTLADLEAMVRQRGARHGLAVECFQTNHEGALVERLQTIAVAGAAAVIINPGAWTHYSYAIRDALELLEAPVAEVHLSAIDEREEWRRHSVIADLATVRIAGKGADGYLEAVDALVAKLASRS